MHVTIARLSAKKHEGYHHTGDDVFGDNQEKFSQGVDEQFDEDYRESVEALRDWLGKAVVKTGASVIDGKYTVWVEVDTREFKDLFTPYWAAFQKEIKNLATASSADFAAGASSLACSVQRLNEAYAFDWCYVLDDTGSCKPISDWLREIQGGGQPFQQVFYIHATYDGGQ